MKPRKPLQQKTPLVRKTRLRGTRGLKSSGPIKPRKSGPSAVERRGRDVLRARAGDVCEIQVPDYCQGRAAVWSHRKRRSQSSAAEIWSLANGLRGCPACERYLTRFGGTAKCRSFGWTVAPGVDPASVPVLRRGVWVWLTEGGGVVEADMAEVAVWLGAA